MADPLPYDRSSDALLRPAQGAAFFKGWVPEVDNLDHDLLCAEMSRLAYAQPKVIRSESKRIGFTSIQFLGGGTSKKRKAFLGTQGFVARKPGGPTVLAFRGTESDQLEDLIADIITHQADWPGSPGCLAHAGFARCWAAVKAPVTRLLAAPEGDLLMTGHSLGAALATLAAVEIRPAKLITFGSPRVGNAAFCDLLRETGVRRFVNCCDLIARLPPERFDSDHLNRLFEEVAQLEGDPSLAAKLKRATIQAVSGALEMVFQGLGLSPSFAHVGPGLYGDREGTRQGGIGEKERRQDQRAARAAYEEPAPETVGPSFEELGSIRSATSAEEALRVLRHFFARFIGRIGSTVPIRDLADHAPINYVSLFTGRP